MQLRSQTKIMENNNAISTENTISIQDQLKSYFEKVLVLLNSIQITNIIKKIEMCQEVYQNINSCFEELFQDLSKFDEEYLNYSLHIEVLLFIYFKSIQIEYDIINKLDSIDINIINNTIQLMYNVRQKCRPYINYINTFDTIDIFEKYNIQNKHFILIIHHIDFETLNEYKASHNLFKFNYNKNK